MRLGYWTVATTSGGLLGWAVTLGVIRWRRLHGRPWLTIAAIAAAMTVPMTGLIWIWCRIALAGFSASVSFTHLMGSTALMCLTMTALSRLVLTGLPGQDPAESPAATTDTARFLDRMPPRFRGARLFAVEAEDHYLRAHTDRGSDLILLRFGDALVELSSLEGAQAHRSWWVARDAVEVVRRFDGCAMLTLKGRLYVPVSRSNAAALRRAGWL